MACRKNVVSRFLANSHSEKEDSYLFAYRISMNLHASIRSAFGQFTTRLIIKLGFDDFYHFILQFLCISLSESRRTMKKLTPFLTLQLVLAVLAMEGCYTLVITSEPQNPSMPEWFYPRFAKAVRYVYFPELNIYYDLTSQTYLYFEDDNWVRRSDLPAEYHHIDLGNYKYERCKDYFENDIERFHRDQDVYWGRKIKSFISVNE